VFKVLADHGYFYPDIYYGIRKAKMTAIAAGITPYGIIIAADGRVRLDEESKAVASREMLDQETDCAVKIFEINRDDSRLAFAMAGDLADNDFSFDLRQKGRQAAEKLAGESFGTSQEFIERLASELVLEINEAKHFPKNHRADGAWLIGHVVFAGYFGEAPFITVAILNHDEIESHYNVMTIPHPLLYGSADVGHDMYSIRETRLVPKEDSKFRQWQVRLSDKPSPNEMQRFCCGYIEACKSAVAPEMDKSIRKLIGGHIHVALVTPAFWRIQPKQKGDPGCP
jgi:hypothetical protein